MIYKIAEFKVKKDKLQECLAAIKEFVAAVKNEPDTIMYESFQKPDEVSFLHIMGFKNEAAEQHHQQTPHVQKFVGILYPNCDVKPEFTDMKIVAQ